MKKFSFISIILITILVIPIILPTNGFIRRESSGYLSEILDSIQSSGLYDQVPSFEEKFEVFDSLIKPMSQSQNWGLSNINAFNARSIAPSFSVIIVGVLDTGIDGNHPSLRDFIHPGNLHKDFVRNERPGRALQDPHGHGTQVAGLIASRSTGVATNIRLVSLRVGDENGSMSLDAVTRAIVYATENNIPILNYSARGYVRHEPRRIAIRNFPGLFVTAAGNENNDNDRNPAYPATYGLGNIVSVGASDESNRRVDFTYLFTRRASNYGRQTVHLFAPGIRTVTTNRGGGYIGSDSFLSAPFWGTSFAAPHVAGTAALMLSVNPLLTPYTLRMLMMNNVDTNTRLQDICRSGGRLNAYRAVRAAHSFTANIWSPHELSRIGNANGNFRLARDIDLSELGPTWTPIPNFSGILDGNGFTIMNVVVIVPNTGIHSSGLFGTLNGAIVHNLSIRNATVATTGNVHLIVHMGALVGNMINNSVVDSVEVIRPWMVSSSTGIGTGHVQAGGIAGRVHNSMIINSNVEDLMWLGNGIYD